MAERRKRIDQARIDCLSGSVDHPSARGNVHVLADRGDDAVLEDDGAVVDRLARNRDDRCVLDRIQLDRGRTGRSRLCVDGLRGDDESRQDDQERLRAPSPPDVG